MMALAQQLGTEVGTAPICEALGLPRASFYRWRNGEQLAIDKPFYSAVPRLSSAVKDAICESPDVWDRIVNIDDVTPFVLDEAEGGRVSSR